MKFTQFINPEEHGRANYEAVTKAAFPNALPWEKLPVRTQQAYIEGAAKVVHSFLADINGVLTLVVESGKELVNG